MHISHWIALPTQSCIILYSFCANLLHSLIMWLIVSFLSPHSQHVLFYWVLSIHTLIWLVLMALFGAAIRRDSVSLLKFPFLSQIQILSREMLFMSRLMLFFFLFFPRFCFLAIVILLSIVSSVSDGCNQSSFVFSYIVFKSLYRRVNAMFDAGESSSSLFSWYT